ncbi:MAG TPA: alpha/beta hydrolase [Burkholderiales bacterium]|nr:alpha/beta hydrolase [Burkholderiales bacterium]
MIFELDGKRAFAYTAAHELDPAKPTLAFVHGAGFDHSLFGLQSRYFGYHGRNVLAVDLPGHGRSEGPPLPTIEAMADWLCSVLKKLKIEKASVVGHSMGSLVALEFAARHPAQCERIALIAVGYPMKVTGPYLEAARNDDYAAFDIYTIWGHAAQVPLGANPNPGMWMYGDTLARLERLAPGVLYNDLKASNDYAAGAESAAKVKCPALFILGRRDLMTPPRSAKLLQETIAGAKTVEIAPSGHTLTAEAPDATLDALIGFLN